MHALHLLGQDHTTFLAYSMFFSSRLPGAVSSGCSSPAVAPGSYLIPTWRERSGSHDCTIMNLLNCCAHSPTISPFFFRRRNGSNRPLCAGERCLSHLQIPLYLPSHGQCTLVCLHATLYRTIVYCASITMLSHHSHVCREGY